MFNVEKDLEFKMVEQKPKTKVYAVWNTQQDCMIGIVKWFPNWRHYCFFPNIETVFSDRCMVKIGSFVEELNLKHKEAKLKLTDNPIPPAPKGAGILGD